MDMYILCRNNNNFQPMAAVDSVLAMLVHTTIATVNTMFHGVDGPVKVARHCIYFGNRGVHRHRWDRVDGP